MKKNIMRKNLYQSIWRSLGRYIAIVAIIALGSSIFVGLRTTKSDMIATGQKYMDEQNMFDLQLMNTYGWTNAELEQIKQMESVVDVEGALSLDVIAYTNDPGKESVYKLHQIPDSVNRVYLLGGRMPEADDECLADGFHETDDILGTTITISDNNDVDTLECISGRTFKVVGYVSTPLYMDMSRGNTTLGNGDVSGYIYLPKTAFHADYYTEINITLEGNYAIYSDAYRNFIESASTRFENEIISLANARYEVLLHDAKEEYNKGLQEYEDGLKEFNDSKADVMTELDHAKLELDNAQEELDSNRDKASNAMKELEGGQKEIDSNRTKLNDSTLELAQAKADALAQIEEASAKLLENRKTASENHKKIEEGIKQIDSGITQIDDAVQQIESGLQQLDTALLLVEAQLKISDAGILVLENSIERAEQLGSDAETIKRMRSELAEFTQKREEYLLQQQELQNNKSTYSQQLEHLRAQRDDLATQRAELEANKKLVEDALSTIEDGLLELDSNQKQAQNKFATAEAQLDVGKIELNGAQLKIDQGRVELEKGLAQLEAGQSDLDAAQKDYEAGKAEAMKELDDAKKELDEAKLKLDDADAAISEMSEPKVYVLDRSTNVGYVSLDSNSDIVEGVSTVFPAFFLLIAALVCITTMTRMIEEERTQIGTLKSLGYSNRSIIGKYLWYAGSAAVVGCGFGVIAGSAVFPWILWKAYGIILSLCPDIILMIDWPLCIIVVTVYTAVTLLVTWYCCRMSLREQPAELIRPKAPTTGKKILLEHLFFWDKLKFLNKVMLRNVFRYKQRLLMMLIGIGGCTALLLTGFGIRDSIVNTVPDQFDQITLFDIEVRFADPLSEEQRNNICQDVQGYAKDVTFYHQSSAEITADDITKDITLIAADRNITRFLDFHNGKEQLQMPGKNEALISIGASENMGIKAGDTVLVRDPDMRELTLTISGIYDNNVYNYIIVDSATIQEQLGDMPQVQMACMMVDDAVDVHEAATFIGQLDGVMNITVTDDLAEQFGSMFDALDLVVITVIICAGALAVIVVYNLTNINITERLREIATIKVLGFNSAETTAYVFKENFLLSIMGAICGLGGGILLLKFVISQIKVDMVWIVAEIFPTSFLLAFILTVLAVSLVDFALYFRLERINMAEALKSVE